MIIDNKVYKVALRGMAVLVRNKHMIQRLHQKWRSNENQK